MGKYCLKYFKIPKSLFYPISNIQIGWETSNEMLKLLCARDHLMRLKTLLIELVILYFLYIFRFFPWRSWEVTPIYHGANIPWGGGEGGEARGL